ncbi:MAG: oxidoreductase [Methylobacter sp.]|nr:MAG: oxidoreductase [Methylobacter sp.]
MQIIKDRHLIEDAWQFPADGEPLPAGDIAVSIARWQQEKTQLLNRTAKLGIVIEPADTLADIAGDLPHFALAAINFPAFTDGRGFSHARLLRDQYGYTGEIRAIGQFMVDQVFYLSQTGFDSFCLAKPADLPAALLSLNDFTVSYQNSIFS